MSDTLSQYKYQYTSSQNHSNLTVKTFEVTYNAFMKGSVRKADVSQLIYGGGFGVIHDGVALGVAEAPSHTQQNGLSSTAVPLVIGSPEIEQPISFTFYHLHDLLSTSPNSHQLSTISFQQLLNDAVEAS